MNDARDWPSFSIEQCAHLIGCLLIQDPRGKTEANPGTEQEHGNTPYKTGPKQAQHTGLGHRPAWRAFSLTGPHTSPATRLTADFGLRLPPLGFALGPVRLAPRPFFLPFGERGGVGPDFPTSFRSLLSDSTTVQPGPEWPQRTSPIGEPPHPRAQRLQIGQCPQRPHSSPHIGTIPE